MSQKLPSEDAVTETSLEETLARYLADNPDFFERHVDLLTTLRIPHYESGRAVSLIERQVEALRHKHRDLHRQLRDLVAFARQNDTLAERLHRFALAMIAAASYDDVLSTAQDMLRQEFKLDAVAILLTGGPAAARSVDAAAERRLEDLLKRYSPDKPVIGAQLDAETLAHLFGDRAAAVGSCAVVALGSRGASGLRGLLALGSGDPKRFHPDMASHYLTKLGDLLMASLMRYL
jgi:hypothetical protein